MGLSLIEIMGSSSSKPDFFKYFLAATQLYERSVFFLIYSPTVHINFTYFMIYNPLFSADFN